MYAKNFIIALVCLQLGIPVRSSEPVLKLQEELNRVIEAEQADLFQLYTHLHQNPELSLQEEQSAARMAKELEALGFVVTRNVGGHGVVGLFKNGPGPVVLVRADMDGLPVTEKTGATYASKARVRDRFGNETGVMHACGHDLHMTCWVGTARALVKLKEKWSGTLMFIAQPAEEIGVGARAMIADGLFTKFPKPDFGLALHCDARLPVGQVAYTEGLALANVDTVDILVKGKGGHGAAPHTTIDPIVLSAKIILDLQTIASREVNPIDPVVITVGSIHGGTKHNIIPNDVKLQLTVRTTKDTVREQVLKAIERKCNAAAASVGAPEPEIRVDLDEATPSTINDPVLTRKVAEVFRELLGKQNVIERAPILGGEDFGRYGRAGVPICMYFLGTIDRPRYEASLGANGEPSLPSMHSDSYLPDAKGTIPVGVRTLSSAVLTLLVK